MKVYKLNQAILLESDNSFYSVDNQDWDQLVNRDDLFDFLHSSIVSLSPIENAQELLEQELQAPIQNQEIWASGVTYYRSRTARMEESKEAGGGDFYDRVYDAERPELFFKSTAQRAVGPGGKVKIRQDSTWDVPEPELTLFINSNAKIAGYTIGNDMSSRSIEGENPLYLPQAKTYDRSASIGPCLYVPGKALAAETLISLDILRGGVSQFQDQIPISQMKRGHQELVDYLYRETTFPHGCYLMTGTGIVPPNEFTLEQGDEIKISIEGIGTLINTVG